MWIFLIALPATVFGLNLFLAWAAWRLFAPRKKIQFAAAGTALAVLAIFAASFLGFLLRAQNNAFFSFTWEFLAWALVPVIYLALWALAGTLAAKIFPPLARFKFAFAGTGAVFVAAVCAFGFLKFENPRITHLAWFPESGKLVPANEISAGEKSAKLRIVATADWHLGTRISRSRAEKFVALINAQKPDIVFIAGDLIDGDIEPVETAWLDEILRELRAPLGVFAVLGNHEYFGDLPREKDFIRRANIRLLQDSVALISAENGAQIFLVGRDDATNRSRAPLKNLFGKIPAGTPNSAPVFVLDHQPKGAREAVDCGADFVFSGHTHAGQLWPATWLVGFFNPHVFGTWREAGTAGYVTSGIGLWHIPYRIGSVSELVVIDVF